MPRLLILSFLFALTLAVTSANAEDNLGFLYGTVTLQDGDQHTGFLRWDAEEAFWDDLFHSRQSELPWLEHVDMKEIQAERRRQYFATHGMFDRLMWTLHNKDGEPNLSRLFIAQFGYLDAIEIDLEENVTLVMRDGERIAVNGYSNDVSSDLTIYPAEGESVQVEWDDLENILFAQAPAEASPYAERLSGIVETTEGTFEGFIQWDQSECTTIDILDGDDDQEIPMGDLQSLTKNRQGTSDVVLKTGEAFTMSGTNDVGGGNRGVMVENPEFGRATIPWKRFVSITFVTGRGSGSGRDGFPTITPLTGTVTDTEGNSWTGRIVYDLDEAWSRDILNGAVRDVEYDIPFGLVSSIANLGEKTCRVTLTSGRRLDLGNSQDSGDKHAGVLVFESGDQAASFIPWSSVATIDFGP